MGKNYGEWQMKILTYSDITNSRLNELRKMILANKTKLAEVTIKDLIVSEKNNPIHVGLYIFSDAAGNILYVGKTSSRTFAERIPSHFDTREFGWFNTFLKEYRDYKQKTDNLDFDLQALAIEVLSECSITLISFEEYETWLDKKQYDISPSKVKKQIGALENLLRFYLQPLLEPNRLKKTKYKIVEENTVGDIINN